MRTSLPLVLLLVACSDEFAKDSADPGHDLDSAVPVDSADSADSAAPVNRAPIADAGDDLTADVGDIVGFDGSGSSDPDGDGLDYSWVIVEAPDGSSATLLNAGFMEPQLMADTAGRFVLELVVHDATLASSPDTVELTAAFANGDPIANAGPDQAVTVGATVQLDGTRSVDPDGATLMYAWTLLSRPSGSSASLGSTSASTPTFVADVAGPFVASLTVSDGLAYSQDDTVTITAAEAEEESSGCACNAGASGGLGGLGFLLGVLVFRRR